jgi:hypothetical protein
MMDAGILFIKARYDRPVTSGAVPG